MKSTVSNVIFSLTIAAAGIYIGETDDAPAPDKRSHTLVRLWQRVWEQEVSTFLR